MFLIACTSVIADLECS